ncbi:acyltransferase family protein [Pseudomonas reactans]
MFLTSGYIITHTLQKEATFDFVIKRIFRIYPLYIFAILAEAGMGLIVYNTPLPNLQTLIPRLLLIGDFFDVPNALAGVEWTLRIEILFYAFMATLKASGLFSNKKVLPALYLLIAIILYNAKELPTSGNWNSGYLNTYPLFLLIGSLIYLGQKKLANTGLCIAVATTLLTMFLLKTAAIQPTWKESNYAILAIGLFILALLYQEKLHDGALLRKLSDLTFSVYLFHNWLWDYIAIPVYKIGLSTIYSKTLITVMLLAFCYLAHVIIEKQGNTLGRSILRNIHKNKTPSTQASSKA